MLAAGFTAPATAQTSNREPIHLQFDRPIREGLPDAPLDTGQETVGSRQVYHLSLEEAKGRTLQHSAIMDLASLQIAAKCYALRAAQKDFLPKILTSFAYFHFDDDLGTVLTTPGILNPAQSIAVPIIEQDATTFVTAAIQPITPLLKVREAVNISAADVGAAEAQRAFARGELVKGVEQLYFGILASQRIRAGLEQAVAGAQQAAAAAPSPDARIGLVQAQQGLLAAEHQVITLTEQMNGLVGLPTSTILELDDPPTPPVPFASVDDAVASAVSASPKLREAARQIEKAEAALRIAHSDYVPNVMAYSFYVNQDSTPIVQEDFTGIGLSASYMLEWGKKNCTYRERVATVALARQNLRKETDDLRVNAAKAYHEANRAQQALDYAQKLVELNRQVKPSPTDPAALKTAAEALLNAEVAAIKADLDFRTAVAELRNITGLAE
jgi:outer membrane protein TolC